MRKLDRLSIILKFVIHKMQLTSMHTNIARMYTNE